MSQNLLYRTCFCFLLSLNKYKHDGTGNLYYSEVLQATSTITGVLDYGMMKVLGYWSTL